VPGWTECCHQGWQDTDMDLVSALVIWVLLYGVAWWLMVAQSCGGFRYQTVPDCC
jgi:hypothetical protein